LPFLYNDINPRGTAIVAVGRAQNRGFEASRMEGNMRCAKLIFCCACRHLLAINRLINIKIVHLFANNRLIN
jgi:hypothetical protein